MNHKHYSHALPLTVPLTSRQLKRFNSLYKVDPNGCWIWINKLSDRGYGRFAIGKHNYYAHRVSYFIYNGTLDDELVVHHKCFNRACVNPDHLGETTQKINSHKSNTVRGNSIYSYPVENKMLKDKLVELGEHEFIASLYRNY